MRAHIFQARVEISHYCITQLKVNQTITPSTSQCLKCCPTDPSEASEIYQICEDARYEIRVREVVEVMSCHGDQNENAGRESDLKKDE